LTFRKKVLYLVQRIVRSVER